MPCGQLSAANEGTRDCKECYSIHAQYTLHSASLLINNGCVGPEVVLEKSTQPRYVQLRSRRREIIYARAQRRATSRNWNVTLRALS